MGDPNVGNSAAECKGGEVLFAIPYAQATLTFELSLDLLILKAGVGAEIILVKFSLPSTNEEMPATATTAAKSCGGVYLKVESLGGKVFFFVDLIDGFSWFFEREWERKIEVTLYEWASPTDWTSNDVTCKEPGKPAVNPPGLTHSSEAPAGPTVRSAGDTGIDTSDCAGPGTGPWKQGDGKGGSEEYLGHASSRQA